jgi:hypothetical protein
MSDLGQVDRRSRAWRRRERRRAEIVAGLGGAERVTPHAEQLINLLLSLEQLLEGHQAKLAAGADVDAERFLAIVKEQRRLVGELGLRRGQVVEPVADLTAYLASKAAGGDA